MAQTGKLSWNVENISADWISIEPMEGTGNTSLLVTVTESTNVNDELTGYIKLKCENGDEKIISVERCAPPCEYGQEIITYDNPVNVEVGACEINTAFTVNQTITRVSTNGCPDDVHHEDREISVNWESTYGVNQTTSPRVVASEEGVYTVTQAAGPCADCGCSKLSLSKQSLSWDWDKTTTSSVTITINSDCADFINITNVTQEVPGFIITYNSSNKKITIKPNGKNEDTENDKTGTITVSYEGTQQCNATISLTQSHKPICEIYTDGDVSEMECSGGTIQFNAR